MGKKLLLLLLVVVCFVAAYSFGYGKAFAAVPVPQVDKIIVALNGYKITAYDVNVKVHENNVLDVTERITAHFNEPKHGIYRNIPLVNNLRWVINQQPVTHVQKAKISNILVTDPAGQVIPVDKENKSQTLLLKIGDAGKTLTGEQTYVIRYSYELGDDGTKQVDELYYNLIGSQWDTYIGNSSFTVEMPKAFDAKQLEFRLGTEPAGQSVSYKVEGHVISGMVKDVIGNGRGLTIRLELPEGYFSGVVADNNWLGEAIPTAIIALCVVLFLLFGRNPRLQMDNGKLVSPDFNSAEAGYILGGDAAKQGRIALLLHWADKGYLCFENDGQDNITLVKCKDADDSMKPYEQTMFNALFVNGSAVTAEQLKTQFTGVMPKVDRELGAYFDEPSRQVYTAASRKARQVCYLLTVVGMGLFSAKIVGDVYSWTDAITIIILIGVWAFVLFPFILFVDYYVRKNGTGSKTGLAINISGFLLMLAALLGLAAYSDVLDRESVLIVAAMGVSGFVGAFIRKRTDFGNRLLNQVISLKQQMASSSQSLTPTSDQFYSLMPYSYMFGMSEKWAQVFNGIELRPPEWFRGRIINLYSTLYFSNLMSDQLNSFESNMTYNDSSGSDGGGGGGGSGGGGGGSW